MTAFLSPGGSVTVLRGLGQPVSLASSADGSLLYVADANSSKLLAVNVATGAVGTAAGGACGRGT